MHFCYILSGWEGSASDGGVFHDARLHDLVIPAGKYYLADAGYPICDALMVPFHGVWYHLWEWESSGLQYVLIMASLQAFIDLLDRPQNYKELYNLRHSQARNVVERIFGVAKKCFAILRETNEYPMPTQAKIVTGCGVIHNFICTYDPDDMPEPWVPDTILSSLAQSSDTHGSGNIGFQENGHATMHREDISQAMWLSYQEELEQRRQV